MTASESHSLAEKTFAAWRADWALFARQVFGITLDTEQQAILRAVQHDRMVAVSSGTARGKDFVAAVAALCFLYLTPVWGRDKQGHIRMTENTKVAMTAPTNRQVCNIMAPEVARLFNQAHARGVDLPGRLTTTDIRTLNAEWFLTGFKADEHNHEAWSGFHAVHTMFVITEATGISDDTFEAIEGCLQGDSRILLVFNPNKSVGYAARAMKSERFTRFTLSSLTAPNVRQQRVVIPGQVDYEWVKDKIAIWCTPIRDEEKVLEHDDFTFEGQSYRPNDTFRRKVLGLFPKADEDILIPRQWIEAAHERWQTRRTDNDHTTAVMGVDVAGMGRDATVMYKRRGAWVDEPIIMHGNNTANHMQVAGRITAEQHRDPNMFVSIDTIGEGAGVYSRCIETAGARARQVISCKYSEAARTRTRDLTDATGQMHFANMRAYLFWAVRDWLDPRNDSQAALPPDDNLDEEASEIHYSYRSDGKVLIEPKDDIKARLGRSTDHFDALANTFYPLPRNTDTNTLARLAERLGR